MGLKWLPAALLDATPFKAKDYKECKAEDSPATHRYATLLEHGLTHLLAGGDAAGRESLPYNLKVGHHVVPALWRGGLHAHRGERGVAVRAHRTHDTRRVTHVVVTFVLIIKGLSVQEYIIFV